MLHTFVAIAQRKRRVLIAAVVLALVCNVMGYAAHAQHLRIRVINARTNRPITDEQLNVALRTDQIGSVAMATNKSGIILVQTGTATIIRILANMYADCRPRAELYTNYSIADILRTGITTGNLCSDAKPRPRPGVLTLFEIPKKFIPTYPAPPASSLPHSDENPN